MFSLPRSRIIPADKCLVLSKIFSANDKSVLNRFKHNRYQRKPLKKFVPSSRILGEDLINENAKKYQNVTKISKFEDLISETYEKDPENLNHGRDRLPEGLKKENLPKYEHILGWEQTHPVLKYLRNELDAAKKTDPNKSTILLEGKRIIQDAMKAGFYPKTFVFSRLNLLSDIPFDLSKEINMVQIPYRNIKVWSDLSTSPGIMGKYFGFQETYDV